MLLLTGRIFPRKQEHIKTWTEFKKTTSNIQLDEHERKRACIDPACLSDEFSGTKKLRDSASFLTDRVSVLLITKYHGTRNDFMWSGVS